MSKIVLSNIYLVNWYGFINTKIPVGSNLTLITGENECGKSTILDAVKYAFTGDTEFNKSSSVHNNGGGKMTLYSYTRCLIDASAGTFARPAEKHPMSIAIFRWNIMMRSIQIFLCWALFLLIAIKYHL